MAVEILLCPLGKRGGESLKILTSDLGIPSPWIVPTLYAMLNDAGGVLADYSP